jgi:hypothetical protein
MMRMFTATYAESVNSTPMWDFGEPIGPMLNGTTYIVRPRMHPSNSSRNLPRISSGAILRANECAIFHARDVGWIGPRQVAVRPFRFVQFDEGAGPDQLPAQPVEFFLRAVAEINTVRFAQLRHLLNPGTQLPVLDVFRNCDRVGFNHEVV